MALAVGGDYQIDSACCEQCHALSEDGGKILDWVLKTQSASSLSNHVLPIHWK